MTMIRRFRSATVGLLALAAAGSVSAGSAADAVTVTGAYARAVPPGAPASAAFMTLTNTSADAHAVLSAASPVANAVELHEHTMENGMMSMRRVERIGLPPGKSVKLAPGGYHVMLIGLKHPLKPGDQVGLTLQYEDGSHSSVTAPVRPVGEMMMSH
jgi:hypothetical protein